MAAGTRQRPGGGTGHRTRGSLLRTLSSPTAPRSPRRPRGPLLRGRAASPQEPRAAPSWTGQRFEDNGERAPDDNVCTVPARRAVDSWGFPLRCRPQRWATRCGPRPRAPRCAGPRPGALSPSAEGRGVDARSGNQTPKGPGGLAGRGETNTGPARPLQGPHPAVGVAEPTRRRSFLTSPKSGPP